MLIDNANIIRQNRKTLKITICDDGKLTIYCPEKLSYIKIENILKSKEKLLIKKINLRKGINAQYKDVLSYNKVLLLGKEYLVVPTKKLGKVYFTEDCFLMPEKYYKSEKKSYYIKKSLREIAYKVLNNRINEILQNNLYYKKNANKVLIGNFKSKWGSCDSSHMLKFNWKMIMLNPNLIDFIIFHELAHIRELNHSKNFYKVLGELFPLHKESRVELKKNSYLLSLF